MSKEVLPPSDTSSGCVCRGSLPPSTSCEGGGGGGGGVEREREGGVEGGVEGGREGERERGREGEREGETVHGKRVHITLALRKQKGKVTHSTIHVAQINV